MGSVSFAMYSMHTWRARGTLSRSMRSACPMSSGPAFRTMSPSPSAEAPAAASCSGVRTRPSSRPRSDRTTHRSPGRKSLRSVLNGAVRHIFPYRTVVL